MLSFCLTRIGDIVHGRNEWELVLLSLRREECMHIAHGAGTLQLLSIQEGLLDLMPGLAAANELLGAATVATTVAGSQQIGESEQEDTNGNAHRQWRIDETLVRQCSMPDFGCLLVSDPAESQNTSSMVSL